MFPYLINIGGFKLATYGVLAAAGYLAGALYAGRRAKLAGIKSETYWNLLSAVVIGALLGGKIFYAAIFWKAYGSGFAEPLINILRDFRFGFVFYGGFFGALAAGAWYVRREKIRFLEAADWFAPAIPLGHAIGRLGCFAAGCCYGKPAAFLAVRFTNPQCLVETNLLGVPLHPVQLYEAAGNFILFLALHFLAKKKLPSREGGLILAYAAGYSVLRFFLEFLRADDRGPFFAGLSPSQLAAVAALLFCAAIYKKLPSTGLK